MNISSFVGLETDIGTNIQISANTTTSQSNRNNKPKRFFVFFIMLLVIGVGTVYIVDSLTEPKTVVVPNDEVKLQELVDKVLKGVPLPDAGWNDLCRLLSVVKGIDINACEECRNYIKALLGGRHYKHYKQYENIPEKQLNKGIKSYEKQIQLHKNKISNPKQFIPNWNNLDPRQRDALIEKKWNEDIKRLQEQKEILECILKNRIP